MLFLYVYVLVSYAKEKLSSYLNDDDLSISNSQMAPAFSTTMDCERKKRRTIIDMVKNRVFVDYWFNVVD